MPLRINRMIEERVIDDTDSPDEDEEDRELFDEFVLVDKEEADKVDEYIRKLNNPEKLAEEAKRKDEGKSMLLFTSKKVIDKNSAHPRSLEDFEILRVIDKGSFGKVFLVKLKLNGQLYAMKRIRKDILIEKGQV